MKHFSSNSRSITLVAYRQIKIATYSEAREQSTTKIYCYVILLGVLGYLFRFSGKAQECEITMQILVLINM